MTFPLYLHQFYQGFHVFLLFSLQDVPLLIVEVDPPEVILVGLLILRRFRNDEKRLKALKLATRIGIRNFLNPHLWTAKALS